MNDDDAVWQLCVSDEPTELKLERACLLRETVGVDGEERGGAVGKREGARSRQGHFTGRMRWRFTAS